MITMDNPNLFWSSNVSNNLDEWIKVSDISEQVESILSWSQKIMSKCSMLCNDLMAEHKEKNNNTSPLSMAVLFGMAFAGLKEEDKKTISAYFGISDTTECFEALKEIYNYAKKISWSNEFDFGIANAWAWQHAEVMKEALNDFDLELLTMNQASINAWVSEKTKWMIKELDVSGVVKVLVNAIALKANWETEFPKINTSKGDFYKTNGEISEANIMHRKMPVSMMTTDNWQYLELPYKWWAMMYIGLPAEWKTLDDVRNMDQLHEGISQVLPKTTDVYLPRFQFETSYGFAGMFKKHPELSCILNAFGGFDEILQKAFMLTNEIWSEVAAITAAIGKSVEMGNYFVANKPFIYHIVGPQGNILFSGEVNDPGLVN